MSLKFHIPIVIILVLLLNGFFSCTKDMVPKPPIPIPPGKWELIPGTYRMYDTLGNFLYKMEIKYKQGVDSNGNTIDSLQYQKLEGQFSISESQMTSYTPTRHQFHFRIGIYEAIRDSNNNRWRIFPLNPQYYNKDSIFISYEKQNILYYMEDLAPYSYSIEKIIGVKVK